MLHFPIQLMLAVLGGDPVVVLEQQKLLGDPSTYLEFFGCAVDVDGARLAVGARTWGNWACTSQGAVHIYERVAGEWEEQAMLSTGVCISLFGESLDLEGDRLAVGASYTDFQTGRVHVYEHSGGSWVHSAELSIGGFDCYLGQSVALDGTTLAAGAIGVANDQGRVAIFEFDGANWVDTVHLQASDGQNGDQFGWSVALEGDTVFVGVPWRDEPGLGADAGAVYVFERSMGSWTEVQKLAPSGWAAGAELGRSLHLEDGLALLAAAGEDEGRGAVYVYRREGGVWTETARLHAADGEPGERFGMAVDRDGDRILVGADLDDDAAYKGGSAYVFIRDGATWNESAKLVPLDNEQDSRFGCALSLAGDSAVVGAMRQDNMDGAAYAYLVQDEFATPFCFGDGSGAACPCGNASTPGHSSGCANSSGGGASAFAVGSASVSADDLAVAAEDLLAGQPALLFAGTNAIAGGDGIPFGDGLRCAGGSVVRLGIEFPSATETTLWGPGLGAQGGWSPGDQRFLQVWYRDPTGPCAATFNLTNGLEVDFAP